MPAICGGALKFVKAIDDVLITVRPPLKPACLEIRQAKLNSSAAATSPVLAGGDSIASCTINNDRY
jgi:hypothetical protein